MSTPLSFIYRSPIYRFYALSILQRNFHTGEYPFKIPAPIKRSSTDILQALADTVKTDETAHHFAYIDDPSTIPTSISQRRLYLLAKEYGRRTAIRLVEEWPTLFMLDRDQPRLAAFRPQKPLNPELVEPTEQNLLHMISTRQVTDALKLYERMGENAENIEINAQMELFKLLCYYNEENIPLDEFEWAATRIYYSQEEERNNEWKGLKNEGPCLAEKLFDKLPKTEETYSYLICGLCKFPTVYSLTQAKILYKEMISAGFTPFEDVFNLMIKNEISLDEDAKFDLNFWLQEMSRHNVRPTVTTFNCIFENLAKKVDSDNSDDSSDTYFIDNSKKKENLWNSAKMFINEMKALNIEPSLNIYAKIIEISPEDVSYRVALLNEIFTNLEEKLSKRNEIKNSNLDDQTFFLNSLSIASTAQSESLLDRTLEIYNDRNNKVKIVSTFDEPRFFENYLIAKLCCLTLNNFFLVYKKFVPNIVPLTPILFGTISDHIIKRKPDEFCWPLLKRLAENFMNSRCISMDKFGAFMLEQLREVRPNQHLSREEAKEYFKLCDKIINLIEEIDRNRELRKAKDEFKLKEKEGILEEDLLLENQKDSKEEEILENVLSNEFYVEDKSHY